MIVRPAVMHGLEMVTLKILKVFIGSDQEVRLER